MIKLFHCVSCFKTVTNNQRALQCTNCNKWVHISCTDISFKSYDDPTQHFFNWQCSKCLFRYLTLS